MSDETQATPNNMNPQAPETGSVDSTPSGQAGAPAEQTPLAETSEKGITNPEAYYKAQAEKFERLMKKVEEERDTFKAKVDQFSEADKQAFEQRIADVEKQAREAREAAQSKEVENARIKALTAAGLDPNTDLDFITGTDAETIKAQVDKLAERVKAGAQRAPAQASRLGNAAPGQAKDLSWLNTTGRSVLSEGSGVTSKE